MDNFSNLSYPSAIKKRVKGDWNCANCENLNFSFRNSCNLCGQPKNAPTIFSYALYTEIPMPHTSFPTHYKVLPISQLPSISEFFKLNFMRKQTELFPLTVRSLSQKQSKNYY